MLINLQNNPVTLYLQGLLPQYLSYRVKLTSRYNNQGILNDTSISGWAYAVSRGPRWYSVTITFDNLDLLDFDLEGYYDYKIEGSNDGSTWVNLETRLCKVINRWNETILDPVYTSDNENNEQYVYYRE